MSDQPVQVPARGASRKRLWWLLALIAAAILVLVTLLALYVRGGGPLPSWLGRVGATQVQPLSASPPAEQVLRSLRLAGYDKASVGDSGVSVAVRLEAPSVRTPSDVSLAWQTAVAAASEAYPRAGKLVVQVFSGGQPLLEVGVSGNDARSAISKDDAKALQSAATYTFLSEGAAK